jgi:hypothetical protein
MMKHAIYLLLISIFFSCSSGKSNNAQIPNDDKTYGYSESNPIKVGGFNSGPANQRNYLNSLAGPNGEAFVYSRAGSCCDFDTKNSPWGVGMLDMYRITYSGKNDTVTLYLNMYDKATLKAPVGLKFK